jgi:hypothetical protein
MQYMHNMQLCPPGRAGCARLNLSATEGSNKQCMFVSCLFFVIRLTNDQASLLMENSVILGL